MYNHAMTSIRVRSQHREEIIDITAQVQKAVATSGHRSGLVALYCPHTTAGISVNENADPDVKTDMLKKLETMIPKRESYYQHGEGNSDSHVKTALVGNSVTVLIEGGRLVLGQWQGVYFCEFDGPRQREMIVKLIDLNPRSD